jgi:hypothetical protein
MPAYTPFSPEEIRDHFRNGAWDDPAWFLAPSSLLDDAGFPLHLRRRAADELRWLYPAEVCRELLASGKGPSLAPLFWLSGWSVCPLLELGLDLAVVGRFDDTKLIAGLRNRQAFESAATEVSVWANLRRQGVEVDRVPTGDGKTPDFRVVADHRLHRLEVKRLHESKYERLRATAVDRAVASGGALGRYEGGQLLVLEIEAADFANGSAMEELLPCETPERRADLALLSVSKACDQLRAGVGIVVVDVGESVDPMLVRETLLAKEQGHPVRFSSCETVIVRGVGFNRFGEPTRYAHPISLRGPLLPVHQLIADAISFRHFRNPTMGRRGTRLVV